MLGPFRVRNLRHPSHPHPQAPRSPTLSTASPRPRASLGDDAVLWIEGERYDRTIEKHPAAKLQYLDEDRDIITVGSKEELAQRLQEPVPLMRSRSRNSVPSNAPASSVHVFQIDRTEANIKIWTEIQQKTEEIMSRTQKEAQKTADTSDPPSKSSESMTDAVFEDILGNVSITEQEKEDLQTLYFHNTNPPNVAASSSEENARNKTQKPASHNLPAPIFLSKPTVLTEAGRRYAQEAGERLKSVRAGQKFVVQGPSRLNDDKTSNRWASYSTALQTAPTNLQPVRAVREASSTANEVSEKVTPKANKAQPEGALKTSFFENFQAQLAKLSSSSVAQLSPLSNEKSKKPEVSEHDRSLFDQFEHQISQIPQDCRDNVTENRSEQARAKPDSETQESQPEDRSKRPSRKQTFGQALEEAKAATKFDNENKFKDAISAYNKACTLLYQIMVQSASEGDRKQIELIVGVAPSKAKSTYIWQRDVYKTRMTELKALISSPTSSPSSTLASSEVSLRKNADLEATAIEQKDNQQTLSSDALHSSNPAQKLSKGDKEPQQPQKTGEAHERSAQEASSGQAKDDAVGNEAPTASSGATKAQADGDLSDEPVVKNSPSDPVEVTVGKMMMQMMSSVISNFSTLNAQIQGTARSQIPQEALRLRGYPDAAHADDLFRDIETLKDAFDEFDVATCDIMRSFQRMHDHDEFPQGSGMLRLQGISNVRGPLPQIATALQNLAQSIQKTCIPAFGETNGRLQYHIPRRLATAGYEDAWEFHMKNIPYWATRESNIQYFVEKCFEEYGLDASISNIRITVPHGACFEVKGRDSADNVLRILSCQIWDLDQVDVSMKRKLYPVVFGAAPGNGQGSQAGSVSPQSSSAGMQSFHTASTSSPKTKLDIYERRKAIQDRRAAWRREYKARTQSVRFDEPSFLRALPAYQNDTSLADIRSHSTDSRKPLLLRPQNFVAASTLRTRLSVPVLPKLSDERSRSRSPEGVLKSNSTIRRASSLHFKGNSELFGKPPSVKRDRILHKSPQNRDARFGTSDKSKEVAKEQQVQSSTEDHITSKPSYHATDGHQSLPYSDLDPAGYMFFGNPENEDANEQGGTLNKPAQRHSWTRPSFIYSNDRTLTKRKSFPPLPTWEPLIPLRRATSPQYLAHAAERPKLSLTIPNEDLPRVKSTGQTAPVAIKDHLPPNASRRLFIGKLPLRASEPWVRDYFAGFGSINKIEMSKKDPSTGLHDGSCYIEFEHVMAAVTARNVMAGYPVEGTTLYVSFCELDNKSLPVGTVEESSGAFSRRMMGRNPAEQIPGQPIDSPILKPVPFGAPNVMDNSAMEISPVPLKPASLGRSESLADRPNSQLHNGWLQRSSTVSFSDRDTKTPSGPWSRRPYSATFDGAGRQMRSRTAIPTANISHAPARPPKVDFSLPNVREPLSLPVEQEPLTARLLNVPADWRDRSRPIPSQRPISPISPLDEMQNKMIIDDCIVKMKDLGYGDEEEGSDERLLVIAQAAAGDLEDAIDMIEEERQAWSERGKA